MKREFPLFIVDHNRAHKFGEVDFIILFGHRQWIYRQSRVYGRYC